ncbi:MAG: hypothetical protein JWM24_853 [Solirubrobacterales bacterium]|nr:hypothetical protein [Solirubrobacterales bacterium]
MLPRLTMGDRWVALEMSDGLPDSSCFGEPDLCGGDDVNASVVASELRQKALGLAGWIVARHAVAWIQTAKISAAGISSGTDSRRSASMPSAKPTASVIRASEPVLARNPGTIVRR